MPALARRWVRCPSAAGDTIPRMDFDRLANRHRDAVYRQMVRVCGNHDDAEDALAQALVQAYQARVALRDEEAFKGWLSQIARRICGRMRRSNIALPTELLDIPIDAEDIEGRLEEQRMQACVKAALASLPEPYRQVYELRDLQELSGEETAERLEISLAAMKSRLHRARAMMREAIDSTMCPDLFER